MYDADIVSNSTNNKPILYINIEGYDTYPIKYSKRSTEISPTFQDAYCLYVQCTSNN